MKIRFKKTVAVDYFSDRLQEWIDHTFSKGETVEVKSQVEIAPNWSDLQFDNNDVAVTVPNNSFEIC